MTLAEALDIVVSRTHHEHYRWLCSDANPKISQRDGYRQLVMEQATGEIPQYPELAVQQSIAFVAANRPTSQTGSGCGGCGPAPLTQ